MEPKFTIELEQLSNDEPPVNAAVYYPAVLRALAGQLGIGNDFYYPLLGAANLLEGK